MSQTAAVTLTPAADFGLVVAPLLITTVCLLVVLLAFVVGRRRRPPPAADAQALERWQEGGGRKMDAWMVGLEDEMDQLRATDFPDTIAVAPVPEGLEAAIDACPHRALQAALRDLVVAGERLGSRARTNGVHAVETDEAEREYLAARDRAGDLLAATAGSGDD